MFCFVSGQERGERGNEEERKRIGKVRKRGEKEKERKYQELRRCENQRKNTRQTTELQKGGARMIGFGVGWWIVVVEEEEEEEEERGRRRRRGKESGERESE